MIAKTISGLEHVLADEIKALGGENIEILTRAVAYTGDKKMLYKTNYLLRTALRVIIPIKEFEVLNNNDLYNNIAEIKWEDLINENQTIAVDASINTTYTTNSHFIELKSKDAIVDRFRKISGIRPSINTEDPDLRVNIHIYKERCTVSLDSSGVSLHKRGYKTFQGLAPLSEVLASGLILLSSWKKDCNFYDIFCGSGTIITEAAMIATNTPSGYYRKSFSFMRWRDYDKSIFDEVLNDAYKNLKEFNFLIHGSDLSKRAVNDAKINFKELGFADKVNVEFVQSDFRNVEFIHEKGIIVCNPPYDKRVETSDIFGLYKELGDVLKNKCKGYDAWIISANLDAAKHIGLHATPKYDVFNGQLECKFLRFNIYEGTLKSKFRTKSN